MHTLLSLLKASLVASVVFAVAWIRVPGFVHSLEMVLRLLTGYGLLIAILSVSIGLPLILIIEWLRIGKWWVYTLTASTVGTLFAGSGTYPRGSEVDNPFSVSFSPWTRDMPGFSENPHYSMPDFLGSSILGAIVGATLGFAFWYFYTRSRFTKANQ